MFRRVVFIALVAFAAAAAAQTGAATDRPPQASAPASVATTNTFALIPTTDYRIGPSDLLDIDIPDLEKESRRTVRVNASGLISLPLIGSVAVGGLSANQAEALITKRYGEKYLQNPQVSVFVKEFTTERITVEGAVAKPGIFPLAGQMTLLRALALAGGFGPLANHSEVMLFRTNAQQQRQVAVFNIDDIRAGKQDDPQIKGEDLIVVQQDSTRRLLKDSIFRDVLDSINPFSILGR